MFTSEDSVYHCRSFDDPKRRSSVTKRAEMVLVGRGEGGNGPGCVRIRLKSSVVVSSSKNRDDPLLLVVELRQKPDTVFYQFREEMFKIITNKNENTISMNKTTNSL